MASHKDDLNQDLLLLGDTSFGENYQAETARYGGTNILSLKGYDYCLEKIAPLIANGEAVIANLETPLTTISHSPFQGLKKYLHWGDIKNVPFYLAKYNINTVSLANNHSIDYGPDGLKQTLNVLRDCGIKHFGAGLSANEASQPAAMNIGRTAVIVAAGFEYRKSYGVAGYRFYAEGDNTGINKWSKTNAAAQIASIRKSNQDAYIIAYPHWGDNYKWKTDRQTELGRLLIDAGADIVIGHGAHAAQELECYNGKWIIYSLGNFLFNSPGRYNTGNGINAGLIARLTFNITKSVKPVIKLYPILSDNSITNYQPRPLEPDAVVTLKNTLTAESERPDILSRQILQNMDEYGSFLQLI